MLTRRRLRRVLAALALSVCLPALALPAAADPRDRLSAIKRRQERLQNEIATLRSYTEEVRRSVGILDGQSARAQARLEDADVELASLDARLAKVAGELARAQAQLALLRDELARLHAQLIERRRVFAERAAATYKAGPLAYMESFLSSQSFRDLLDRYEHYESSLRTDSELLVQIKVLRDEVATRREVMETRGRQIAQSKEQLDSDRRKVVVVRGQRAEALTSIQSALDSKRTVLQGALTTKESFEAVNSQLDKESAEIEAILKAPSSDSSPPATTSSPPSTTILPSPPPAPSPAPASVPSARAQRPDGRRTAGVSAREPVSRARPSTSTTRAVRRSGGRLLWPARGPVTSGYGYRTHPIFGTTRLHTGIDIGAPYGSSVYAADSGVVAFVGVMRGYGNVVVVDHGGGLATTYNHLSSFSVGRGQRVARGQRIAAVGCTGYCTGPHLHFEVRINGAPVNPMRYF